MLNRIFVREEQDEAYSRIKSKRKIGVIGIGNSVGTSLVATSVAKELSIDKRNHIAYVEVSNQESGNFVYDALGMDKRFAGRKFYNFYKHIIEGKSIGELMNLDERINWALHVPKNLGSENIRDLENIEFCRLINNIHSDYVICDISVNKTSIEILKEMDNIICVIDPLPSKIIKRYDEICELKKYMLMGHKILWVINKYNDGINKKELHDFIRIKEYIRIPAIPTKELYLAEYNCKIPYSSKPINLMAKESICSIVHKLNT